MAVRTEVTGGPEVLALATKVEAMGQGVLAEDSGVTVWGKLEQASPNFTVGGSAVGRLLRGGEDSDVWSSGIKANIGERLETISSWWGANVVQDRARVSLVEMI